jgi:hypothetical protein
VLPLSIVHAFTSCTMDNIGHGYYYSTCQLLQVARKPPGFGFIDFDDPRDAK